MILEDGPLFIADTHVNANPTPQQIADAVIAAARHVRRFGVTPNIALCSNSQFGNLDCDPRDNVCAMPSRSLIPSPATSATKARCTPIPPWTRNCESVIFPNSRLMGQANVLVFATTDAASGVRNILKMKAGGLEVGPILMGMGNRAHIVTPSITARGLAEHVGAGGHSGVALRLKQAL